MNKYVWLVETIYRAKRISLKELNRRWLENDMSDGQEIPERTFHKWRIAVEELFGLDIVNEGRGDYRYYIENADELSNGNLRSWLFNTLSVSTLLQANLGMKERILLEEIPEGKEYLPVIIEAMKNNVQLIMTYQSYWRDEEHTFEVEPYCLKLFRQRWYLVARSAYYNKVLIYALDRVRQLQATEVRFTYPKDFQPDEYFDGCFGIIAGDGTKVETVRLKASAGQANYLRSLPLHHSQEETERNDAFSIFTLRIRPTFDFIQELLRQGEGVEVLSPVWLRKEVAGMVCRMWNKYKEDK
jgi:hypothetical protein